MFKGKKEKQFLNRQRKYIVDYKFLSAIRDRRKQQYEGLTFCKATYNFPTRIS